jgi:hypothetical protein
MMVEVRTKQLLFSMFLFVQFITGNLAPNPSFLRQRKINKADLRLHVDEYPHLLLRERASIFNVHISSLGKALRKMNIVKKTKDAI